MFNNRKTIIGLVIFAALIGIAGLWYWNRNYYSKDVLRLEILGPDKVDIFKEVEYTVKYKNNGNVLLENVKLNFEFPEYTFPSDGIDGEKQGNFIKREEKELEDIYPGEEKTFKIKCRLFGKEGDIKTAKAILSYNPKNLSADYKSTTTLNTVINSVPLTFDIDAPSKIESGRTFNFSLNYFSNLDYPIPDLGIKIEYPDGFEFASSSPKSLDKSEWDVPVLNKAEGGRIDVTGRLSGDLNSQKIFKASIGMWNDNQFIVIKDLNQAVEIAEPRISITQQVNGSSDYTADSGDLLHYEIFFRNISEESFSDIFLAVNLDSKAFDLSTLRTDGQYTKGSNSILWDSKNSSYLRYLGRGDQGKVEFWVNLKDWTIANPGDKNAVLKDSVLVSQVKESFEVKMNTKLSISQRGYFDDDVFGNSGPVPPKVGEATTYTIIWGAKNYYNDVKNMKVKATLPQNVKLTGSISPDTESSQFTYDSQSREVVWKVKKGDLIEAGTGVINQGPSISFQVSFTPTSDQIGAPANLVNSPDVSAEDQWTNNKVESTGSSINTNIPDDLISSGKGTVQ